MRHLGKEVLLQRGRLQWVPLLLLVAWPVLLQVAGWVLLLQAEEVLLQPGGKVLLQRVEELKKGELKFILPCFYIYFMNPLTQRILSTQAEATTGRLPQCSIRPRHPVLLSLAIQEDVRRLLLSELARPPAP